MTNPVKRADKLRALTGLAWTAAENFHSAVKGDLKFRLRLVDGVWLASVDDMESSYPLMDESGTWEEVCDWVCEQVGLEAA